MIKQGLLLLAAATACLALGDGRYYSKKNAFQAPSQYASVATFHSSKPEHASKPEFAAKPEHASKPEEAFQPQPYAFGYESADSARQESSDASGKVSGSYRVTNEDGSVRVVKYVADRDGFRADIDTDEPGMGPDSPAHVQLKSATPPKKATQFSAPAVQQAPARGTHFSAPALRHQAAPIQVTKFSAPAVQQAPLQPYAFSYDARLADGSSSRSESADASGRVTGSYSLSAADGRRRHIQYTADQGGFRADVDTNEFGTGHQESPASVTMRSSSAHGGVKSASRAPAATYQGQSSSGVGYGMMSGAAQQKPSPYTFEYAADLQDGSISRSESADGSGKVVGSYSLSVADGRQRKVDYLADAAGFRATVNTNEFGTKADSPADVHFYSSATLDEPAPYSSPRKLAAPSAGVYSQQGSQFSAPAIQQAPIQVTRFSGPAFQQQAPLQQQQPAVQYSSGGAYSYDYRTSLEDGGSSARRESGDGAGRVTGSYSMSVGDGRRRQVDYSADVEGFRASVDTNELGTRSDSPASVHFHSSAPAPIISQQHMTQFSAPAIQPAPIRASHFSAPAVQQAPVQVTRFSAPAVQQAPVQEVAPSPYAFEYESDGSARRESADASGIVTGSYEVRNADGSVRVVQYVADGAGFRANVKTNEPGTKSDSPADVVLHSDAAPLSPAPVRQSAPFPARSHTQKTAMLSQQHVE